MMVRRCAVALAFVLGGAALAAQNQPQFSTRRDVVRVDVLVTDRGQPVRGLGASDFEVVDNGVPQKIDFVSFEQIPLNVILAVDLSASVAGERLDQLRTAGRSLLQGLTTGDQGALITFSQMVVQHTPLTANVAMLRDALDRAQPAGDTALVDGVFTAMMVGESDVGRALLIVFSDGVDTASWLRSEAVLETAKRSDVVAYVVSIEGRPQFLRDLSSFTGGSVFDVDSKTLTATFMRILDEFRHRYLVSYSPEGVDRAGWHKLEVRVRGRGVTTVKARPGYLRGES